MTRGRRVLVTAMALSSAVLVTGLLISLSATAEGPLSASLDRVASALASLEQVARERLAGPGRRRELGWFEVYRQSADRLRHPDVILLGAYDEQLPGNIEGIQTLERDLETTFPLVQFYSAWGDRPEHQFPLRLATSISNMGSVPVITWEPWLSTFENARHPFLPLRETRDAHGLAAVARGDYDFYVDAWATDAATFAHPVFVRFAHEMNDPYRYPWGPQHDTKEEFIAAWRHVVERFRRAGATNVVWVWSPHVAYEYWDLYYPGSEYVDWVATGALNFGPIAQWSKWWSFEEIFGARYPQLAAFGKPVMVAEFGSLSVGGDRNLWYREALRDLPTRHPAVQALLFFNAESDQTVTYQKVNWTVSSDAELVRTIATAIGPYDRGRQQQP